MILPALQDVAELVKARNIPTEAARELLRLATARQTRSLRVVPPTHSATTQAAERAAQVREEFLWALYADANGSIPWPWEEMDRKYGALMPGDVHVIVARTNVGKTTVVLNVVDSLIEREIPVHFLPFETPPFKLTRLLAAIRLQINPVYVARNEWHKLPAGAQDAVRQEGMALLSPPNSYVLSWAPQGSMNPAQVLMELERAADCGVRVVVIDHLHRIELEGKNGEAEMRRLVRALKDKAEKLELVLLNPAQANRGERDPLRRHLPPVDTDIRGAGAVEEEADGVLGLYMPLREDVTPEEMAAVRRGLAKIKPLVRKNTAGIRFLKHRIDGSMVGEDVFLEYDHGRLREFPLRDFGRYDV
jgi:replicative DNA helicase